MTLEITPIF